MELTLRQYGNSAAVAFPPSVLRDLGIKVGQLFSVSTTPSGAITLTPKTRYVLAELIAQCDLAAPPPADMAAWEAAPPMGGEVW
jgi:antitoxin ChpS